MISALWALLLLPGTTRANGINPHFGEGGCLACHSKTPSTLEAQAGQYFLLRESIEETCGICHELSNGQGSHTITSHPTGIRLTRAQSQPSTLPLSAGYITCKTCHHCIARETDPTFALLRISINGPLDDERTELCKQCHEGY